MTMHRLGESDHPSKQINVRELRERLHLERLARFAATPVGRRTRDTRGTHAEPSRLALTARARRHLVGIAVLLVLMMGGAFVAAAADTWRNERESTGWIKACISCHGRVIEQPSPSASASATR